MNHVKVAVRVRPPSQRELETHPIPAVAVESDDTISVTNVKIPEQNAGDSRERVRRFTFDFCFGEASSQEEVFRAVEKVVVKAIGRRHHSCVLAYGQSSTGKTHSMMGIPEDPGITPKLCQNIFGYLKQSACDDEMENLKAKVSYLEIYNEKVRDLLSAPENSRTAFQRALKIREHPKRGPYVQGLSEHSVSEPKSLLGLLQNGNSNRRVAATATNPHSSRSHSVFTLSFRGGVKLHLVDLAGSERAGSYTTSRFREGANINKSLVALGNVISALADKTVNSRRKFIPYRDSALTWLLRDTLGGNSKTVMIATVSPSSGCYNETVNTLRFGQRAKLIISQPVVNEDPKDRTIRELRGEIARLKELLLQQSPNVQPLVLGDPEPKEPVAVGKSSGDGDSLGPKPLENFEELIPIMNVSTTVPEKPKKTPLQRTLSVDAKGQDTLAASSSKRPASSSELLRKRSVEKPGLGLRNLLVKRAFEAAPKRLEKAVLTDLKGPAKVEAKVDTNRRASVKPRSQIVAAVTHRLYSKVKKKEASTETDSIPEKEDVPRELQICSNARLKLQELTRQALKAHRRRNEETQTDLFPVLRVKETATDVEDLRLALAEVKDAETNAATAETKDVGVECSFLENLDVSPVLAPHDFKSAFVVTRSCGTQSCEQEKTPHPVEATHPVSFTKYLQENAAKPRFEIVNACTANPIYTTSVNINVSHNYISGSHRASTSDNASEDSLEANAQQNVCFPTPDLISNHNSLEPHAALGMANEQTRPSSSSSSVSTEETAKELGKIKQAECVSLSESHFATSERGFNQILPTEFCVANCVITPKCEERLKSIALPEVWAAETCVVRELAEEHYKPLTMEPLPMANATVSETQNTQQRCSLEEPIILKSIMKQNPDNPERNVCPDYQSDSSCESSVEAQPELPDSLNYHRANSKRVRFNGKPKNNARMMEAMSSFLEEAASLMTNLNIAAGNIESNARKRLEDYELQVTVNDITMPKARRRRGAKCRKRPLGDASVQTSPKRTAETSANTDTLEEIPANKYESVVEESCRKLEERIDALSSPPARRRNSFDSDSLHRFPQPFEINPWQRDHNEDSSLESNPTYSDYGSLPRRRFGRPRNPSCSPSAFLRQLASMRQQIIESTREELEHEADLHT